MIRFWLAALVVSLACWFLLGWLVSRALAAPQGCNPPPTAAKLAELPSEYPRFHRALRSARGFGVSWRDAAVVAWREATWHAWARNGQYLGTFQLGALERAAHGHGATLEEQVYAAASLWHARGWSAWECRP